MTPLVLKSTLSALLAFAFVGPASAQAPNLNKVLAQQAAGKPAAAAAPAPEKPDETKSRLLQWQKEARDMLSRLDDPEYAAALPAGITPADLEERRRDTEQVALSVERYLKAIDTLAGAAKIVTTARDNDAAWNGFKEPPPYSLLFVDDLLNEQDAVKEKLASLESSLKVFRRTLGSVLLDTKTSEEKGSRLATLATAANASDADKWRYDATRTKTRAMAARAGLVQCNCDLLTQQIEATRIDLSLLARKIRTAKVGATFTEEDVAKMDAASQKQRLALRKEMEGIAKRLTTATAGQKQARAALAELEATVTPEGTLPDGLELARVRNEVAEEKLEALQAMTEGYESLLQLENLRINAYQDRLSYLAAAAVPAREKALASLTSLLDRLRAWEVFLLNENTFISADLTKQDARAAGLAPEDPRVRLLADQRLVDGEQQALYQRISQTVVSHRKLLERWVNDYTPKKEDASVYENVTSWSTRTWETIKKIWSFKVMKGEDITVEVEGIVQTVPTDVTLGVLLRALFVFLVGYWALARVSDRIQRTIVHRGHVAEAQARTLRNWAMIVLGVFLAITTLSLLKIPLTIFAFFGGALAIGLGFGSQTLIKNFISGIIVLFERKVRVGDIVDVGGIAGSITEINTRSSVLRSADGRETLVPNSVFLETSVTNLTLASRTLRRMIVVGAAYGTPPAKVMKSLAECAERHGLVLKDPAPLVIFADFADSALVFRLYFWVNLDAKTNPELVESDIRIMIEKSFEEAGIIFPFPQREVRLVTVPPTL